MNSHWTYRIGAHRNETALRSSSATISLIGDLKSEQNL
jgi:hypothetical protein